MLCFVVCFSLIYTIIWTFEIPWIFIKIRFIIIYIILYTQKCNSWKCSFDDKITLASYLIYIGTNTIRYGCMCPHLMYTHFKLRWVYNWVTKPIRDINSFYIITFDTRCRCLLQTLYNICLVACWSLQYILIIIIIRNIYIVLF